MRGFIALAMRVRASRIIAHLSSRISKRGGRACAAHIFNARFAPRALTLRQHH